ncbi:MAG: hypothetical protein Q4D62_00025 [Planctomycetia bacterium]|nr:hypothetical protein [Planctomycetia bacterium]
MEKDQAIFAGAESWTWQNVAGFKDFGQKHFVDFRNWGTVAGFGGTIGKVEMIGNRYVKWLQERG